MKQLPGILIIALLLSLSVVVGLSSRSDAVRAVNVNDASEATHVPVPTKKPLDDPEPYLYAPPIGVFVPFDSATIYEWPNQDAMIIEIAPSGTELPYTSEWREGNQLWLCVRWEVSQSEASWNCTGWAIAEKDGERCGEIERSWSPPERKQEQEQNA